MSRGRRPPQGLGKEGGEGWGPPSDSRRNRGGGQGEAPEASTSWQVPWPGVLASSPAVGQQLRWGGPLGPLFRGLLWDRGHCALSLPQEVPAPLSAVSADQGPPGLQLGELTLPQEAEP